MIARTIHIFPDCLNGEKRREERKEYVGSSKVKVKGLSLPRFGNGNFLKVAKEGG